MSERFEIPCPSCGRLRVLRCSGRWEQERARERLCMGCAGTARREFVDEMAVERLLSGSPVRANAVERRIAVVYLTRHGLSARQVAERLRVTQRTVVRLRARARAAA
jgi:DNA-binding NarL/FixJ family response regulator